MATLLGHLARFGSFSMQAEVLCTQGFCYLLSHYVEARSAFADALAARTGVDVGHEVAWLPEQRQPDGARPDLEGRIGKTPTVKIEAKLDARLDAAQFRSYIGHLRECLRGRHRDGVLIVMVTPGRIGEAKAVVRDGFGCAGEPPWRLHEAQGPDVVIAVVSWDDMLAVLEGAESEVFRDELHQFKAMYEELSRAFIWPFADREELYSGERGTDLIKLVDHATRRLTTDRRVLPMYSEPLEQEPEGLELPGYNLRYVCRSWGYDKPSCFSIGVRHPFEGTDTPVWMRFHRITGGFREIFDRLASSAVSARLIMSGGHVWIPLDVPLNSDSPHMVDALIAQVEEILQAANLPAR